MIRSRFRPLVFVLAWLLHYANASPPLTRRREFYALKGRLLERYGRRVGTDWQELVRYCYGCEGTGRHLSDGRFCRRCGGSGIWDRTWNELERWELAGRVFHRFGHRRASPPDVPITIRGRVTHRNHGLASDEATLWLALFFDWPLFACLMTRMCVGGTASTWRYYPLVTLQRQTFRLAQAAHHFERRSCTRCGRKFRQGFRAWGMICFYCARCERQTIAARPCLTAPSDDEDVPF